MAVDDPSALASSPSDSADIDAVLFFLRGAAEADIHFNGTSGEQAFDAFARLLGEDPADLWKRTGKAG